MPGSITPRSINGNGLVLNCSAINKSRHFGEVVGGAIFTADRDNLHPVGFGYSDRAGFLRKNVVEPMDTTDGPFGTIIAYTDDLVYSGYVSDESRGKLAGKPALIAERSDARQPGLLVAVERYVPVVYRRRDHFATPNSRDNLLMSAGRFSLQRVRTLKWC